MDDRVDDFNLLRCELCCDFVLDFWLVRRGVEDGSGVELVVN